MKHYYVIFLAACLAAYPAQAARIRDMSLSPEESMRQPDITHSRPHSWEANTDMQTNQAVPGTLPPGAGGQAQAGRFMDGYCDPNFKPLAGSARGNAMQSCMNAARQEACQTFYHLPADAQAAIDDSVSCVNAASEAGEENPSPSGACQDSERRRLTLAKKYWDNQAVAHALVALPEMVTNPLSGCMGGGR